MGKSRCDPAVDLEGSSAQKYHTRVALKELQGVAQDETAATHMVIKRMQRTYLGYV